MQIHPQNRRYHADAAKRCGRGFTLVELLVVMTVMVTLGGMLTYALASAATDARIKRTQADVLTIGQLLQTRMNEVSLSKVSLFYGTTATTPQGAVGGLGSTSTSLAASPGSFEAEERSRLVLMARRDLVRMVLPECRADLLYPPATLQFRTRTAGGGWQGNVAQIKPPAQWNRMRTLVGLDSAASLDARLANNPCTDPAVDGIAAAYNSGFQFPFNQFADGDLLSDDPADPADRFWSRTNESAECLYLILATTEMFGGKAIDRIPSTSIGDTDGDGFLEILDAWGNPYEMIRNPAGLSSRAIRNFVPSGGSLPQQYPQDPDPFDFLLSDYRYDAANFASTPPAPQQAYHPYYLPPVVISAGQDGEFGIRRTFWIDEDGVQQGVKDFYSASAVRIATDTPSPRFNMAYRYPDPFFNVAMAPISGGHTSHDFTLSGALGIRNAREGGGLGGTFDRETAGDNITSLGGDL
ncbi:type II secretion system protein [Rhodopirellula sp. JC639]|uniref:type II secretion system protein n=1 Tax=Stieleria mannarensis TaxID=2755585 RepID=UPI0016039617|nr:type II secretion system protein [Rhodopirellula sp. JC639]